MAMPEHTSKLCLGGGGTGQIWGETSRNEAIATVQAAWEGGITLFDNAPIYGPPHSPGEAEIVLGQAFDGSYPENCAVTTKCMLGTPAANDVYAKLDQSLNESLERLQRPFVDVFILHGYVVADDWQPREDHAERLRSVTTPWTLYTEHFIPAMDAFVKDGRIRSWGITALMRDASIRALQHEHPPHVVQCIANPINSSGSMGIKGIEEDPQAIMEQAVTSGVGVMGIRAVAAGSLTDSLDRDMHPKSGEAKDFERSARFRDYADSIGESAASLAHRYALSLPNIDTVVLGVKNRVELAECLNAEKAECLTVAEMESIRGLFR
jgi:aryl-alcohol dehydrogenase-like predicted oxidoreductase